MNWCIFTWIRAVHIHHCLRVKQHDWKGRCTVYQGCRIPLATASLLFGKVRRNCSITFCGGSAFFWTLFSGVASYGALGHVPPRFPTISFLAHFRVNLTTNYPSIAYSARLAGVDINNSQLFQSVLH